MVDNLPHDPPAPGSVGVEGGGSDEVEGNGEDGGSDEVEGNGEDGESEEVQGNDENGESEVGGDEIVSPERNGGSSQDDVEASPTKSSDGSGCENSQTPMKDGCDGPASDSGSERNAPTLQLGGSSSEASEEEGAPKSKVVMSPRDASESIEDSPICSSSEGEPALAPHEAAHLVILLHKPHRLKHPSTQHHLFQASAYHRAPLHKSLVPGPLYSHPVRYS